MRKPAAVFPIVLALGTIALAPVADARADGREEGPFEIEKCQTISTPGSYKLVDNLTLTSTSPTPVCLLITADFVTVDLAGFTISGVTIVQGGHFTTAIEAGAETTGIAVRNGSISNFFFGVNLAGSGSVVEGLRVMGSAPIDGAVGIAAAGIVKGNIVAGINAGPGTGTGIRATGIVTGNYAMNNRIFGIAVGQGSTVIGNTATGTSRSGGAGISVDCPSNVIDNTAVNNSGPEGNLLLNGTGCNDTNNVAP
jgi:hypothetical protein